jgi:hypothetical protein
MRRLEESLIVTLEENRDVSTSLDMTKGKRIFADEELRG